MNDAWNRVRKNLTFTEQKALTRISNDGHLRDGFFTAADVAADLGISRGVIVTLLRLLTVAGLVQSQSCGMKGTRIRILWNDLPSAVAQLSA
jgi:transcriptional pleiotropic repressor